MNVLVAPKTIPRMIIAARKAHALSKIQATATANSIPKMVAGTTHLSMRVPSVDYGARLRGLYVIWQLNADSSTQRGPRLSMDITKT